MHSLLHALTTAMIPRRCASCGTPLDGTEAGWCIPCAFTWSRATRSPLDRFGGRLGWAWANAWLKMTGQEERRLVHALKYGGDPRLGRLLGRTMALELHQDRGLERLSHWAVVPIPLHRRRQRKRGYNQSLCLAEGWNEITAMPVLQVLRRIRAGRSLTGYDRRKRIMGEAPRFLWSTSNGDIPLNVEGLILMDDVITTGSTLEEAHQALRAQWPGPIGFAAMVDAAV